MSALVKPLSWFYHEFGIVSIHSTGLNAYLIILARTVRMFAYGTNSLILAIFFSSLSYSDHQIGIFMTLTLLGDVFLGTFLTLIADRVGRRKVLLAGSFLMVLSGIVFAVFENFWILLLAAVLGVISITGGDFGPFRSIEESVLSQLTTPSTRADVLAWYVTTSTLGSSIGSEASGRFIHALKDREGWTDVDIYHSLFWVYAIMGLINALLVLPLSSACELQSSDSAESYSQVPQDEDGNDNDNDNDYDTQRHQNSSPRINDPRLSSLPDSTTSPPGWWRRIKTWFSTSLTQISRRTRHIMYKLWFLLAVDSLADGMVPYSLTNYYIDTKFHPAKSTLGDITSVAYFLGAVGAVFAGPLARKIGLINTMVFTHVPSSAAVLLFPLPPRLWLTAGLLMVRAALNNMDQAPRAAFIAAVVLPAERTAVMGITSMLRTLASMAGPTITGLLAANDRFWIAFVAAGVCRLAYDFGLYALFVNVKVDEGHGPDEEKDRPRTRPRDEEEDDMALEMDSLVASDDGSGSPSASPNASTHDDGAKRTPDQSPIQKDLSVTAPHQRVRSRSPHRSTPLD